MPGQETVPMRLLCDLMNAFGPPDQQSNHQKTLVSSKTFNDDLAVKLGKLDVYGKMHIDDTADFS